MVGGIGTFAAMHSSRYACPAFTVADRNWMLPLGLNGVDPNFFASLGLSLNGSRLSAVSWPGCVGSRHDKAYAKARNLPKVRSSSLYLGELANSHSSVRCCTTRRS